MTPLLGLFSLLCLAFVATLTFDGLCTLARRRARTATQQPLHLQVIERKTVGNDLLCLKLGSRQPLPAFQAGQHLLISAPAGRAGKTIQRAYSLAAWSAYPQTYELGIKRQPNGAMSQWMWATLQAGDELLASPPQGNFVVEASSRPLVLIGAGIGITPIRAMLHAALGEKRRIFLFHAAKTAEALLYCEEFLALAARHAELEYIRCLSQQELDHGAGQCRLSAQRILAVVEPKQEADYYLCANPALVDELRNSLIAGGIPEHRIHHEVFAAPTKTGSEGHAITVKINGLSHQLLSAGEPTVLACLEANAIALPTECRAGSCGKCAVQLDAGQVDWLVKAEFPTAPNHILPCICAARSALHLSTHTS